MKHGLLPAFLITAFLVSSCSLISPIVKQRWFLDSKDFQTSHSSMRMQISGAEMNGNKIRLFVHVTDMDHFFYRGIPTSAFCNPSVTYNGVSYPIQNFKATEYRDVNRENAAYALVLDYSGSMRHNKDGLYEATRQLVQNKRDQDAYSIVRYANQTVVDAPLTVEKSVLLSQFTPEPGHYIGNLTATWDGVADGISTLEGSPYATRTLIVFTDGGENASKVTQEWAFWRAKMAGVRIVAISLGTGGAQNMKDLCETTGGMYIPLNNIEEVADAYTDLKNKMGSFYLVEFETPVVGKQTVQLNLCENIALHDTYAFDNRPPGPEPVRLKQPEPTQPAPPTNPPTATQPPVATTTTPPTTSTPRPTEPGTTPPTRPTPPITIGKPTTTVPSPPRPTTGTGTPTGNPVPTPSRGSTTVINGGRGSASTGGGSRP